MAESILEAIRVASARGADPQTAVDAFAPVTGERNTVEHWLGEYVERSTERDELSPNTRHAIESHARLDIAPWWSTRSLTEIDAGTLEDWTRWLRKERGLRPSRFETRLVSSTRSCAGSAESAGSTSSPSSRMSMSPNTPPRSSRLRTQALILGASPQERRGAFLALCHGVRPGEPARSTSAMSRSAKVSPGCSCGRQ
jgi:hypothetical protein